MANYKYIARAPDGESVDGVMQAESEAAVLRTLQERSLFPVQVSPAEAARSSLVGGQKVRPRQVGAMFSQMSDLLRAGVPMLKTLDVLIKATTHLAMKDVVKSLRDQVSKGKTLSQAMGEHPRAFTELHRAMVSAGEEAGFLEDALSNLADFMERQDELRSRVRGMLIYPLVLLSIGTLAMGGILVGLVPRFKGFFRDIELPLPTRVIFAASDLMVERLPLLLAILVLLGFAVYGALRSPVGRDFWEVARLKIPLLGRVNRSVSLARFCRILGTTLHNGVPILQSLQISQGATGSRVLGSRIEEAAEAVRAGEPLADPFRKSGLFPPDVIEMIAVAEESNQMDKVLVEIANTVERRTNRQVDAAMRLVEPLILVVLAVGIGFVAVGLLYPIFIMSQTLMS